MALTATELDLKTNQKRLDSSVMALEALRNVIKNNAGITTALLWHVTPCLFGKKIAWLNVIVAVLTIERGVASAEQ